MVFALGEQERKRKFLEERGEKGPGKFMLDVVVVIISIL